MAIRYTPLELDEPQLFGIGLSGTVSRADKQNLLSLADRCLERGKLHVILDMTGLTALGGGGARVLADFQLSLTSRSGEAVFVGAGTTVRRFLRQRFDDLPLQRIGGEERDQQAENQHDRRLPQPVRGSVPGETVVEQEADSPSDLRRDLHCALDVRRLQGEELQRSMRNAAPGRRDRALRGRAWRIGAVERRAAIEALKHLAGRQVQVGGYEDAVPGEAVERVGGPRSRDPGRDRRGYLIREFEGILPGEARVPQCDDELDRDQGYGDCRDCSDPELRRERH